MKNGNERFRDERTSRLDDERMTFVLEKDDTVWGVVWVAAMCTIGMALATVVTLLAGFSLSCVVAMGIVAVVFGQLTIAAAIHNRPLQAIATGGTP